jgi:hypothetical protein
MTPHNDGRYFSTRKYYPAIPLHIRTEDLHPGCRFVVHKYEKSLHQALAQARVLEISRNTTFQRIFMLEQ